MPQARAHGAGTKRDAILGAAADLLLERGYDGTSMDAVAAAAGVSKTTVYAHFADKDKLFHAVMVHAASVLVPNVSEAIAADVIDSVERLVLALTAVVQSSIAPELIAFFRVLIAEHDRRSQFAGALERARAEGGAPDVISILAPFLSAVAAEREVELIGVDQWVILLLRMSAPAVQFDMLTSAFSPTRELVETHVRLVVGIFVNGAFPARGGSARLPDGYERYPWGPAFER